jgi:arginyl-tRNA synthetase
VAELAGWKDNTPNTNCTNIKHIGFGVMLNDEGHRIKTRSGESTKLIDFINDAVVFCEKEFTERDIDNLSTKEIIMEKSQKLAVAAIKYFDLKQDRLLDYKFSFESMLNLKGNTAMYLLYTYARFNAIITKCNQMNQAYDINNITITEPDSNNVLKYVVKFYDVLLHILGDYKPHKLCTFVYDLCNVANGYYQKNRVIDDINNNHVVNKERLFVCSLINQYIKTSLELLGIPILDIV